MSRTFHARGHGSRYRNHTVWFQKNVKLADRDPRPMERRAERELDLVRDGYFEFSDTALEERAAGEPWCLSRTRLDYTDLEAVRWHEADARMRNHKHAPMHYYLRTAVKLTRMVRKHNETTDENERERWSLRIAMFMWNNASGIVNRDRRRARRWLARHRRNL